MVFLAPEKLKYSLHIFICVGKGALETDKILSEEDNQFSKVSQRAEDAVIQGVLKW